MSLPLMGCAALGNGRLPTPEQIVLGMNHAKEGVQRTVLTKPAPGGVLVIHKEFTFPLQNPDEYDVGYGYVTLDPVIGWSYAGGGSSNGTLTRPVFLVAYPNNPDSFSSMVVGLVRDARVSRVTATFSNGQAVQDTVVSRVFGMVVVPAGLLCKLELWDIQGQPIESYDYTESHEDVSGLTHVKREMAAPICP